MKLPTKFTIYSGVITPFLNSFPLFALTKRMVEFYPGWGFDSIISIYTKEGDESYWIEDDDIVVPRYKALLEEKNILTQAYEVWLRKEKAFYEFTACIMGKKINLKDFDQFIKFYNDEYAAALLTEYFYLGSEYAYKEAIKAYPAQKDLMDKCVQPLLRTFNMENERSLLKLASGRTSDVKGHTRAFFWLYNNYKNTQELPESHFAEEVDVLKRKGKAYIENRTKEIEHYEERQEKYLGQLKHIVQKRTYEDIYWVSKLAHWHDRRKKANLIADHFGHLFLHEAAKAVDIPFQELQFTTFGEVQQLLQGKKMNLPLKERMKGCVHVCTKDGAHYIAIGKEFLDARKLLDSKHESQFDIRGTAVSFGVVRGIARVISSPQESIQQGEILVTSMTRPEFVPLMKKAAAIVTNEGGMTSHAAIIARELGLPCIVGTQNATKIIKTGMKIEVNCNHGVVKILK